MPEDQPNSQSHLKKFAVNESGSLGYILEEKHLGEHVVYSGISVADDGIWMSIKPNVINEKVDPGSLLEIVMQIAPPSKIGKISTSGSINIDSAQSPISNWNTFFTMQPDLDIKQAFENFVNDAMINPKMKPPKADDFQIDSEDKDEDDDD